MSVSLTVASSTLESTLLSSSMLPSKGTEPQMLEYLTTNYLFGIQQMSFNRSLTGVAALATEAKSNRFCGRRDRLARVALEWVEVQEASPGYPYRFPF